jgi:metal-responsive CopG/Arc/MetJ family transcriptional regulator
MKIAIAVEDALMEEADQAARNLGLSRGALIAAASREYLPRLRQTRLTEQLNQAYVSGQSPVERKFVRKLRRRVLSSERW